MNEEKKENKSVDEGVIEIPVGKFFSGMRQNPWLLSTIVLAIVLVVVLFTRGGAGVTGNVISEDSAAANLLDFINAQGNGVATLTSAKENGGLYEMVVNYNGQDIPVYVTLDGKYLISDRIPLTGNVAGSGSTGGNGNTATGTKVDVEIGESPVLGSKDAKVVIVEFSDYECPFCGRYYTQAYGEIKKNYVDTGKVLYVMKDFPLSFHAQAQKASESARCVREQKGDTGYFQMHDKLFVNQQSLSVENEKKWARELGVDGKKFDDCLDSGKFASAVAADETYGQSLGISGTPGFFINGILVEGAQPYSAFEQIIEAELAK